MIRVTVVRVPAMAALLLALGACDDAPAPVADKDAPPAAFPAGEWEVSTRTETLRSADKSTPATTRKIGETIVAKVCAAPGPKPDLALFTEAGDRCTATSAYAKDGRLNLALSCNRPGKGLVAPTVEGKYDASSFEVINVVGTYFSGSGDYVMNQKITGKRLGDCTPAAKAAG